MKIERHIFGSRTGYTTLACSEGLNASDCRKLEVFAFGQTSDRGYLHSLANTPAYISKPLGGSRRVITRVLPGQPDDMGRNTLLLVSAVLSNSDWVGVIKGDVLPLLDQSVLWQWDGQPKLASLNVLISGQSPLTLEKAEATELVGLISELERLRSSGRNVVISEPKYTLNTVRAVQMLIPDSAKPHFACAARSLSANLGVDLNCVARGVGISTVGPGSQVYRPRTDGLLSPYAAELVRGQIMQGRIPEDIIRSYRGFGTITEEVITAVDLIPAQQSELADPHSRTKPHIRKKRKPMSFARKVTIGYVVFGLVACSIITYLLLERKSASDRQQAAARQREEDAKIATDLCKRLKISVGTPEEQGRYFADMPSEERDQLLNKVSDLVDRIEGSGQAAESATEDARALRGWTQHITPIQEDLVRFEAEIRKIENTVDKLNRMFPPDELKQLSTEQKKRIEDAVQLAEETEGKVADKGLSQTALRDGIERLQEKAKEVQSQIEQRESVYREFVKKMLEDYDKGFAFGEEDIEMNLTEIDQWIKLASADQSKKKELEQHKERYTSLSTELESLKKVEARIRQNITYLKNTKPSVVQKALKQYAEIVPDAEPFRDELKGLLEEAAIAEANALATIEDFDEVVRIAQQARKITVEIQTFLSADTQNKGELAQNIQTDIKELQKLDKDYASDLLKIFKTLQRQSS